MVPEEVVKDFGKNNVGFGLGIKNDKKIIRVRMNISKISDIKVIQ